MSQTVTFDSLSSKSVGLAIATAVFTVLAGLMLQYTKRVLRMPTYFKANYTTCRKNPKLAIVASICYYLLLLTPLVLLLVWLAKVGSEFGSNPAIPFLFFYLFSICLILPTSNTFFYYKVLACFILLITAQLFTMALVWDSKSQTSFFCLTAVLLTVNGAFTASTIWLIDGNSWSLAEALPSQLKKQVIEVFDIWAQEESPPAIITGGLYNTICKHKYLRLIAILILYLLSLLTLLTYSLVCNYHTYYAYQGLINSLCIITTDIIICILIFITKDTNFNPTANTVVGMLVRACIIALSSSYWFLGYCLLYLILMVFISLLVIDKHYPTFQKLANVGVTKSNLLKMPEVAALFLLLMFSGLTYFVGITNSEVIRVLSINLSGIQYPFWAVGVATILLGFSIFFYMISVRIVSRSRARIRSSKFYYFGCQFCSEYYFHLAFSYAFLVILGLYLFFRVGNSLIWVSCVFLPLFYQAFVLFYTNWEENEFLLLGSVKAYNLKVDKRQQRLKKIETMKMSVTKKIKVEGMQENSKINLFEEAEVESNFMVEGAQGEKAQEWRDEYTIVQAWKEGKLLPTDRKIVISIIMMLPILLAYSILYFFIQDKDFIGFTVSLELLFLFLTFIPMKRYFSTLQTPLLSQIILFILGIVFNYAYGIASYVFNWHQNLAWHIWWAIVNPFILSLYAAFALLRDKGITVVSLIAALVSFLLLVGIGVLLLAWHSLIPQGLALLGIAVYYGLCLGLYILYLSRNRSLPWFIYPIVGGVIVLTCIAVMIYAFVTDAFDNFYGFSITYLVLNFLMMLYAGYLLLLDIQNRFDRPNFYSPYGSPVLKYDANVSSVIENTRPLILWLAAWFMYFGYTLLMIIFIEDSNIGVSAMCIFLVFVFITFFYFVTYNTYKAGKISSDITPKVFNDTWKQVLETKKASISADVSVKALQKEIQKYTQKRDAGITDVKDNHQEQLETQNQGTNIDIVIHDLEHKLEKQIENQVILLVNLWTKIMFKCETARKKKMLKFINFVRDQGENLTDLGIIIVLDNDLYDIESVFNQAYQKYSVLPAIQKLQFDKRFKDYIQLKNERQKQDQQLQDKEQQMHKQREEDLRRKLQEEDVDDSDQPLDKMKDSPAKLQKILQTAALPYEDSAFTASPDKLPPEARSCCSQWVRPKESTVIIKNDTSMSVRQGYIGDCYLISAIGVLNRKVVDQVLGLSEGGWKCPKGAYMARFKKYGKNVHIIIDDKFPVGNDGKWLLGRCQDQNQIYTNILEKAYAKLYGGYQNIVGGKVSIALADITGGFPQEISLKKYQEQNTNQIFNKMVEFKKAGYLMGAGSPPNAQGDAVDIDGIVQGHAYLILDVRDLDGNKLIKLRNPHGNKGRESQLDWSDDSPKWTKRLLNLLNEQMREDGAFWMGLQDFVYCYRSLYLCRIFDPNIWKRRGPIQGVWKGESAAGLPSRSNPTAKMANNPHYGIKTYKKSTVFVQLVQNQTDESRKGKNFIFFMCQKNDGRRITTNAVNKLIGVSGSPINSVSVSAELALNAPTYPYTFSLLVSAYKPAAEGSYTLSIFSDDKDMQIIDTSDFDA